MTATSKPRKVRRTLRPNSMSFIRAGELLWMCGSGSGIESQMLWIADAYGMAGKGADALIARALVTMAREVGLGEEFEVFAPDDGEDWAPILSADLPLDDIQARLALLFAVVGLFPFHAVLVALDALAIAADIELPHDPGAADEPTCAAG